MGPLISAVRVALRAYIERRPPRVASATTKVALQWPESVLVFDTETTTDATQRLLFGCYRWGHFDPTGRFVCIEEGLFHGEGLTESELATLQAYVAQHTPAHRARRRKPWVLQSRQQFANGRFARAIQDGALIVGYNLPFDLARLAVGVGEGRQFFSGGFSLTLFERHVEGLRPTPNPFLPRIRIKHVTSKHALMGLTNWKQAPRGLDGRIDQEKAGRFLDLRSLVFALTGESRTLEGAADAYTLPITKLPVQEHGVITEEYITYARRDVEVTCLLAEATRAEWDRYELSLTADKVASPASLAKASLRAMGLVPPMQKFDTVPPAFLGHALSAYCGGRTEVRVRRTPVPVVYTDFLSMYPTVNTHLRLWELLTAEHLELADVTAEVQQLGLGLHTDWAFDPANWPRLRWFARVCPDGDILPLRAHYTEAAAVPSIGVNPVHGGGEELWVSGPDLVASWYLTGRWPEVVEAIALVPHGVQPGLRPITFRGEVDINPITEDFFKRIIEARKTAEHDPGLVPEEQRRLSQSLKVVANSGSYGILAELIAKDPQKPQGDPVTVWGHATSFEEVSRSPEDPGEFCFPPIAALITAGGRLMLALLEAEVARRGGTIAFGDTDSAAIVATKEGGPVTCTGGAVRDASGEEAISALSWRNVEEIVERFEALNPYDPDIVPGSVLKIEEINRGPSEPQREVWAFAISAKRYALFTLGKEGEVTILDRKEHGLGHLLPPNGQPDNGTDWITEVWLALIREGLGRPLVLPDWVDRPAVSRTTVSSPELLELFQGMNASKPYRDQVKPFNFLLSVMVEPLGHPAGVDPTQFHLVAPYETDPTKWPTMEWINRYNGMTYAIGMGRDTPPDRAQVKSYRDVIMAYRTHPEAKSLGPDGEPCSPATVGVLGRRPVAVGEFYYIGKEANKYEEVQAGLIHDPAEVRQAFQPPSQTPWERIVRPLLRHLPVADLAVAAGVSERAVKYYRAGTKRPEAERWPALGRGLATRARRLLRSTRTTQEARLAASAYLAWWQTGDASTLG